MADLSALITTLLYGVVPAGTLCSLAHAVSRMATSLKLWAIIDNHFFMQHTHILLQGACIRSSQSRSLALHGAIAPTCAWRALVHHVPVSRTLTVGPAMCTPAAQLIPFITPLLNEELIAFRGHMPVMTPLAAEAAALKSCSSSVP